eukprot:351491-Chlamydomonas_euryale.AAC.4
MKKLTVRNMTYLLILDTSLHNFNKPEPPLTVCCSFQTCPKQPVCSWGPQQCDVNTVTMSTWSGGPTHDGLFCCFCPRKQFHYSPAWQRDLQRHP